jgi:hypothetical protein
MMPASLLHAWRLIWTLYATAGEITMPIGIYPRMEFML